MPSLSKFFYRISTGRAALAATVLFLLFMALVLPGQAESAAEYSEGAGSPDQSFFYSAEDIYAMAEAYGPEGRQAYIRARFTFDVIFPIFYMIFLGTTISWAFSRAFQEGSRLRTLNLFPVLGLLFDYGENIAASIVMAQYPAESPLAASLAPVLSMIKWFFVNGSFVVLAIGLIAALVVWRKNRAL